MASTSAMPQLLHLPVSILDHTLVHLVQLVDILPVRLKRFPRRTHPRQHRQLGEHIALDVTTRHLCSGQHSCLLHALRCTPAAAGRALAIACAQVCASITLAVGCSPDNSVRLFQAHCTYCCVDYQLSCPRQVHRWRCCCCCCCCCCCKLVLTLFPTAADF
jgi:hypothetical protein